MKLDAIQFNTSTTDTPSWTKLVDLIYPKNSIYLSMGTNGPGDSVGGAWTAITTGAVLALTGSNGFAEAGKNGGSLKISVNQMPSHNHSLENLNPICGSQCGWSYQENTGDKLFYGRYAAARYITEFIGRNTAKTGGGRIICLIITPSKDITELPSNGGDVEWL